MLPLEPLKIEPKIPRRGGNVGVPEERLHRAQIEPARALAAANFPAEAETVAVATTEAIEA